MTLRPSANSCAGPLTTPVGARSFRCAVPVPRPCAESEGTTVAGSACDTRDEIRNHSAGRLAMACLLMCVSTACLREAPPEISDPATSARRAAPDKPIEEAEEDSEAAPAPPPPPVAAVAIEAAPKPPAPEAKPAEAAAPVDAAPAAPDKPTIVGTWRIVEGTQRGQPMPPGMNIQFTFGSDGTLSMAMSMPMPDGSPPRSDTQSGTYSLDGDRITISIRNETKTGTLTLEGNTKAILDIDDVKFTLERQ